MGFLYHGPQHAREARQARPGSQHEDVYEQVHEQMHEQVHEQVHEFFRPVFID